MTTFQSLTAMTPQAFNVTAPVPLHHSALNRQNAASGDDGGRETPLPQYEKTPQSVPFTLNLQEDQNNPGQFQLVVNVNSKLQPSAHGAAVMPTPRRTLSTSTKDISSPTLNVSTLYQTQKSSPPTSPSQDKQGWSDLGAIPPDFLKNVVPDWDVTFTRSDSTASTHSTLADIKAKFKKKGRGYVVRLLKGSTTTQSEVADVDLGLSVPETPELDASPTPAELDSTLVGSSTREDPVQRTDLFEIGTSGEQGVQSISRAPSAISRSTPSQSSSYGNHPFFRNSIAEEGLSDAETLVSARAQIHEERVENEQPWRRNLDTLTRSTSISSIVPTPTRGLSVRSVRRVDKGIRYRPKTKLNSLELKRSAAHKSMKRHSPRGSTTHIETSDIFQEISSESTGLRHRSVFTTHDSDKIDCAPEGNNTWQHPRRKRSADKPVQQRRSSADNLSKITRPREKLRLQTNIPHPKSAGTSPATKRKRQLKTRESPLSSSTSSPVSSSGDTEWSEVNTSHELREALTRALRNAAPRNDDILSQTPLSIPTIVEPIDENDVGQIPLPSELEIRSAPATGSPMLKYWVLAFSALTDSVHKTFGALLDRYGTERPVPPQHVRVRWTCSCGEALYDDFIERRPGAARLLEAYLNRPRAHTPTSPTSRSSTATSMASVFSSASRSSTLTTPSSTYGGASSWGRGSDKPSYSPARTRVVDPFSVRIGDYVEESWLLTCANEGRLTPKIVHLDVNAGRIRSDKDLALVLREHYEQLNRRWLSWARLRDLATIEFVQFEVHRNRFADIRATPSMPPVSANSSQPNSKSSKSLSPSEQPYTFEPIELLPPVGSTYLLHLFKHPSDYDGELITYLRSPKRRERLDCGMGWGINLVEGFVAQRVWTVALLLSLGSGVFATIYTWKIGDIQGAFGVAGWMLGISSLLIGGLQAWLE